MLASPYYHGDSLYVELVNAVDLIDMNQITDPLCLTRFVKSRWVLGIS